jgi:hypothetical protein
MVDQGKSRLGEEGLNKGWYCSLLKASTRTIVSDTFFTPNRRNYAIALYNWVNFLRSLRNRLF